MLFYYLEEHPNTLVTLTCWNDDDKSRFCRFIMGWYNDKIYLASLSMFLRPILLPDQSSIQEIVSCKLQEAAGYPYSIFKAEYAASITYFLTYIGHVTKKVTEMHVHLTGNVLFRGVTEKLILLHIIYCKVEYLKYISSDIEELFIDIERDEMPLEGLENLLSIDCVSLNMPYYKGIRTNINQYAVYVSKYKTEFNRNRIKSARN